MNLKRLVFIAAIAVCSVSAFAQFHSHLEIGGSNFMGFSFATEYQFKLYNTHEPGYHPYRFHISPKLGVGHIFIWDHALTLQIGLGIGMALKNDNLLELNSNISYLTTSPISPREDKLEYQYYGPSEGGNYLWYSGMDYKILRKRMIYTIGIGAITLVDRSFDGQYRTADFIPMVKLGVGL